MDLMGNFQFSRSDPLEKAFFRMGKLLIGAVGVWPSNSFDQLTKIKVFVNLTILFIAIVSELRFTWLVRDEPLTAIDAICPCLTKLVTAIKLACFIIYRKEMGLLLQDLFEYLAAETRDEIKNSMIAKVSYFTTIWWLFVAFFGLAGNLLFTINPIIKYTFQRLTGIEDNWVDLPFQAALPYKDMTILNNKFLYTIVYSFLVYSGCVTVLAYPGADGTFMCFSMYFSISYECLQEDFKQAFNILSETRTDRNNQLYKRLSMIVERQQHLNKMYSRFNDIYVLIIFGHFLFASITLGVVLVNLVLVTDVTSRILNLVYVLGACTQLYGYCYGPEKVNQNFSKIAETLYFVEWYSCNKKVKSLILIIMIKSQRENKLRVPFFSPSLQLFASVISTSRSYFTLLQTFCNF